MKKALITGITGQDGSYLAEFLLEKGYEVHGLIRRSSISNTGRIDHLIRENKIVLHGGDLSDSSSLVRIIGEVRPDEIYNLGAQSHVQVSFEAPEYAGDVDALGVLRILEAVRIVGLTETCRIYQASTSELYGRVEEVPQNENTPFHPYSPYAVAKQYGFWIVKEYRDAYNMFAVNGILFNHESERRGENFVTRKITLAAGRIACGIQDKLYLGNLDSKRDWGYARDYPPCIVGCGFICTPLLDVGAVRSLSAVHFQIQSAIDVLYHVDCTFLQDCRCVVSHRIAVGRIKAVRQEWCCVNSCRKGLQAAVCDVFQFAGR